MYGTQVKNANTQYKSYPAIYEQEKLAVINGIQNEDTALDFSDQDIFIERADSIINSAESIQPYQTAWEGKPLFADYKRDDGTLMSYSELLMHEGTSYWVASRGINTWYNTYPDYYTGCDFCMKYVSGDYIYSAMMYSSHGADNSLSCRIFPIISLSSELIKWDEKIGFCVK